MQFEEQFTCPAAKAIRKINKEVLRGEESSQVFSKREASEDERRSPMILRLRLPNRGWKQPLSQENPRRPDVYITLGAQTYRRHNPRCIHPVFSLCTEIKSLVSVLSLILSVQQRDLKNTRSLSSCIPFGSSINSDPVTFRETW